MYGENSPLKKKNAFIHTLYNLNYVTVFKLKYETFASLNMSSHHSKIYIHTCNHLLKYTGCPQKSGMADFQYLAS